MEAFPDSITYGKKYGPAMEITDQGEADAYLERCVVHSMEKHGLTHTEATIFEKSNIGYWAGYYSDETMKRVYALFCTAHPVVGTLPFTTRQP